MPTMSLFWWVAAFNDWRVTIHFAQYGEHWIEGVLFHSAILVSLWVGIELIRGKHEHPSIESHIAANPRERVAAKLQNEANS